MLKFKKPRVGIKIDMTPMVDVAFLLLTFFMLTTQFKPPEELAVILPSSHSPFKIPESDVTTLSISKDGRIFMGVDSQHLRVKLFGEGARLREGVEVQLNQLENLLKNARMANPKMRFIIKGDKDTDYGNIMDIMDVLEKTRITRFNLVTDLERE